MVRILKKIVSNWFSGFRETITLRTTIVGIKNCGPKLIHTVFVYFINMIQCPIKILSVVIILYINNPRMFNVGTDDLAIKPNIPHKSLLQ